MINLNNFRNAQETRILRADCQMWIEHLNNLEYTTMSVNDIPDNLAELRIMHQTLNTILNMVEELNKETD